MSIQNTVIFQHFSPLNHFQWSRPDAICEGEAAAGKRQAY